MDPAHLTQKLQEALHDAQTKALRIGHQQADGEHLLLALLDQGRRHRAATSRPRSRGRCWPATSGTAP
jgi:ATP-dependent Clp protease ATP-binding subunit ClpA